MDSDMKYALRFVGLLVLMIIYICVVLYTTVWVGAALHGGYFTSAVPVIMLLPLIAFAIKLDDKRRKEALEPKLRSGEWTPVQNMDESVGEYLSMSDEEEKKDEQQ